MAYAPGPIQGEIKDPELVAYIQRELQAISDVLAETQEIELRPRNSAPTKIREGMIVFADGTHWNPGAGKGVYVYSSGAWSKL